MICTKPNIYYSADCTSNFDMLLHKLRGWVCIKRIRQMIGVHNDSILANQVQSETERLDFARVNTGKWSSVEWVAENDLCAHQPTAGIEATGQLTTAAILAATSALTFASPRCTSWAP